MLLEACRAAFDSLTDKARWIPKSEPTSKSGDSKTWDWANLEDAVPAIAFEAGPTRDYEWTARELTAALFNCDPKTVEKLERLPETKRFDSF